MQRGCVLLERRRNPVHSQIAPEARQGQRRARFVGRRKRMQYGPHARRENLAALHFTHEHAVTRAHMHTLGCDARERKSRAQPLFRNEYMEECVCVCAKLMNEYREGAHTNTYAHQWVATVIHKIWVDQCISVRATRIFRNMWRPFV